MAYDGSLIFDTKIDNKGFQKGVNGLKSAATGSMKVVTGLMKAAAVAVVGVGIASIKAGSQFEAGMSQVAATMGITVDEIAKGDKSFQMLEKAALQMGKTTQFSATEASEALNYLALAGYDAEKAVETLPKVLNLAAAGGLELGQSAEIITQSMNALGIETDQLEGFVDQLAVTAQSSGTTVEQLGQAILTVGGTAKIMAGGTVELNTQLGILADAGIQGAEGGTALRNVLLALSAPTDKQAKALKDLGVSAYDSNGDLRHTDDIFQDLNGSLEGMTEQEKQNVLSNLFNKVDLKAANALLAASGDRFEELSTKIEQSEGAAAEMAATMNDNLLGKIELLKSAMEYLGIVIYKSVDSPISGVIETFTGYIDKISGVLTAHDDARASMEELGYSANQIEEELKNIPTGFKGAAVVIGEVLADMITKFAEAAPRMLEMGVLLITSLLDGIRENLPQIAEAAIQVITGFAQAYMEILPEVMVLGIELITSLIQGIAESLPTLIPVAVEAVTTVMQSIMDNLPLILAAGIQIIVALIEGIVDNLPQLIEMSLELVGIVADAIIDNLPLLIEAGLMLIMAIIQGIMDNLPALIVEVPRIINSFADAIYSMLPTILKTGVMIILELIKGLIKSIPTLVANIPQIIKAIVNVFTLYNWLNLGKSLMTKLGQGIKSMVGSIGATARSLATAAIEAIKGIFTQAPGVGSGFVRGIMSGISSLVGSIGATARGLATSAISAIKGIFAQAPSVGSNMVKGIWNGISNVTGWILSKIRGFGTSVMNGIKNIFGIKSPSTKTRDIIGKNLVFGIGDGIEREMPNLQRDIDNEMSKLTAGMQSTVDIESNSLGRGIIGGNRDMKRNIMSNSKNRLQEVSISGNTFVIREEADINKVARQLHQLQLRKSRG